MLLLPARQDRWSRREWNPRCPGKGDQGILLDPQFFDRIQYADLMVHVLDEPYVGRPFLISWLALLDLLQPILGAGLGSGALKPSREEGLLLSADCSLM